MGTRSVAVVGVGFGGIAAVVARKQAGYDDVVVLERSDRVGGVWRANTYPGAACDIPSPLYSYSFAPNPDWPHRFARQPAILRNLDEVTDAFNVRRHIRLGAEVVAAGFDQSTGEWTVTLRTGEILVVDILVCVLGQLSRPAVPQFQGVDRLHEVCSIPPNGTM